MSNLIAACAGDMHVCPIKGHGFPPIMPNGSSILVEGKPIAWVGDVTGCGAVITQGYPLAIADGMPVAYLGSPTSHGGSIVSGNSRVLLGVATNTAPVVDFAMAGALDDKGQLTPAAHVWYGNELLMSPELKALLKQRYIHHSDHYLIMYVKGAWPIYPFQPAKYGRRGVHPNKTK
ncbi:PAAR domain-containing protein [Alkalimarinus sediminis]|uniref:PAAR domain-containing protein n=1 Tax=Alkalimarinus sediminis TaxID=1632866 RepID=A0A9E8HKJ9_9ALTE|nr:PAAR domain-containing protein [Alkalimarinus sediminis]UZW74506.1 PAAR domain-containing protein [Alkalimarinus sediminis]